MSFLYVGAGGSAGGVTDGGFGANNLASVPARNLLNNPFGPGSLSSRRIDPVTRDYVMGTSGSIQGMTEAQQAVELAFTEVIGKTAVNGLGNSLAEIKVIADDFVTQVQGKISAALSKAVNRGLISVQSIDVQRMGITGAYATTRWTDLSTNIQQERTI